LLVTTAVNRPLDGSNLGEVIQAYMRSHNVSTHGEMAAVLGIDRTLVSKYVSGARRCHDVTQLRRFAEALDVPPSTFGLVDSPDDAAADDGIVSDANERWKAERQALNRNRHELSRVAADLYWDPTRIEGTTCITKPGWMPDEPVDLRDIELFWVGDAPAPDVTGNATQGAAYRGENQSGAPYQRYSQAIRALAKPSLFENRGSYRLLDLRWDSAGGQMRFGYTTYFDMIDVCELMAHELSSVWSAHGGRGSRVSIEDLPFRGYVGDLFDLRRRTVLPSINTLTIRRSTEGSSFFMHRRGSSRVVVAGGTSHVIPAGVFQPSGIAPWNMAADFDLWRSILREYSEEMLGNPEHDGSSGEPIDYGSEEPFRTLNEGRRRGQVKTWCFGVGIDPLVPAGEILTATVIDAEVFDAAFSGMVARNSEGDLYPSDEGSVGIAWTAANVRKAQTQEPLASAAAACIALGWKHRDLLLQR
jgi:transcriptional regulator with XRE-family HTH domain